MKEKVCVFAPLFFIGDVWLLPDKSMDFEPMFSLLCCFNLPHMVDLEINLKFNWFFIAMSHNEKMDFITIKKTFKSLSFPNDVISVKPSPTECVKLKKVYESWCPVTHPLAILVNHYVWFLFSIFIVVTSFLKQKYIRHKILNAFSFVLILSCIF